MLLTLWTSQKTTWTKAAAQGFIPESFVTTGTNMEFLSKLLLGEEEVHGALSDATQQISCIVTGKD